MSKSSGGNDGIGLANVYTSAAVDAVSCYDIALVVSLNDCAGRALVDALATVSAGIQDHVCQRKHLHIFIGIDHFIITS